MSKSECKVYERVLVDGKRDLRVVYTGSRAECQSYLKQKGQQNKPIHFNYVSALPLEAAKQKFL